MRSKRFVLIAALLLAMGWVAYESIQGGNQVRVVDDGTMPPPSFP